jgi:hypothetical protein
VKKKQLPYILIDGPSPFGSLEIWERFLAEVQAMPDFLTKQMEIRSAKWMIASIKRWEKKRELDARQLSFQFPDDAETSQQDETKAFLASQHSRTKRPASGTIYRPAGGVQHPGDMGVIFGRTASDARLSMQATNEPPRQVADRAEEATGDPGVGGTGTIAELTLSDR